MTFHDPGSVVLTHLAAARRTILLIIVVITHGGTLLHAQRRDANPVIYWNRVLLKAIGETRTSPTVAARALALVHTSIYDAWSAYDPVALSVEAGSPARRPVFQRSSEAKRVAINYAAYRTLSDLFPSEASLLDTAARETAIDPSETSVDPSLPAGVGNLAAAALLADRHHDGSNQLGDLHPGPYSDYTSYRPVNTPDTIASPDHWQPLRVPNSSGEFTVQKYLTPQWNRVKGFAVIDPAQYLSPLPPATVEYSKHDYVLQAQKILELSSALTDRHKVIAEYWALGPGTVTPPGRWFEFAQFVSERDRHSINDDVKLFFLLGNTMLDASIVCWNDKRAFDSERPITAIHYLFAGTPVRAWAGPYLGTQWIDGADWIPYQEFTVVTPAFPEFMSGHSTFSAAGARILALWTGSNRFGAFYTVGAGSSSIEPGLTPQREVILRWPTFAHAANEAGLSRRLGGIHFRQGDLTGREIGARVATQTWQRGWLFINGASQSADAPQSTAIR